MKVAIVGGKGFIGKPVAEVLSKEHEVDIWDLPEVDVRNPETIRVRFDRFLPEVVINLAGILGGLSSSEIRELLEVNFVGNLNVLDESARRGVKRFIFASSLTVHGTNQPESPNRLDSPFRPIHAYGAGKASSEFVLQEYARRFNMVTVAVRPTMVLGNTAVPHAFIEFVKAALKKEDIVIYGSGDHEREWIWIADAVEGFRRALNFSLSADPGYYPFFLSGNRIRMKDLAKRAAELLGGQVRFVESNAKAFTLTCDTEESERALGWKAGTSIDQMIVNLAEIFGTKN